MGSEEGTTSPMPQLQTPNKIWKITSNVFCVKILLLGLETTPTRCLKKKARGVVMDVIWQLLRRGLKVYLRILGNRKLETNMKNIKRFLFSGEDYKPTFRDLMYFIALVLLIALSAIQL